MKIYLDTAIRLYQKKTSKETSLAVKQNLENINFTDSNTILIIYQ